MSAPEIDLLDTIEYVGLEEGAQYFIALIKGESSV